MEIPVTFYNNDWWPGANIKYTCQVQNVDITSLASGQKVIEKFKGNHKKGKKDSEVIGIRFDDCKMDFVPRGFCSVFTNVQILLIFNSKINKLEKDDFIGCGQLKELWVNGISIQYVPGNLFEYMPHLEIVSLQSCGIEYIDPELLDDLPRLKVAKFNYNKKIDAFYDSISSSSKNGVTLEELKNKFLDIKPPSDYDTYCNIPKNVKADIKIFMKNDNFKDLTISIEDETFKAHKFVLAARSSVLCDMIYENPESSELTFKEIKKETFKDILTYIYEDKLPTVITNAFELFSVACRFGFEKLKIHAISNMTTYVTADNAIDLLVYGKLYGNEQLKENAFEEIKKMFPDRELKDELANDTEKIKKIIEAKKAMDEKIRLAQEEFEKMALFE